MKLICESAFVNMELSLVSQNDHQTEDNPLWHDLSSAATSRANFTSFHLIFAPTVFSGQRKFSSSELRVYLFLVRKRVRAGKRSKVVSQFCFLQWALHLYMAASKNTYISNATITTKTQKSWTVCFKLHFAQIFVCHFQFLQGAKRGLLYGKRFMLNKYIIIINWFMSEQSQISSLF